MEIPEQMEITGVRPAGGMAKQGHAPGGAGAHGIWSVPVSFPGNPMRYTLAYVMVEGNDCLVGRPGL